MGLLLKPSKRKPKKKYSLLLYLVKSVGEKYGASKDARKIFSPEKKYQRNETGMYEYSSRSTIVITERMPVVITYNTGKQKAGLSFYIQSYDNQDIAVDAMLQARINGE